MFSREQVFIDPHFAGVLKAWQKDTFFHAGERQLPLHELIRFSKEWFDMRAAELAERRAREEAWREMWSGRKGEILRLFAAIDADADGEIDLSELESALHEHLGSFFGFTQDAGDGMEGWLRAEIEAGHLSAAALFKRLDKDNSGTVSFDEFYDVLNDWFDSLHAETIARAVHGVYKLRRSATCTSSRIYRHRNIFASSRHIRSTSIAVAYAPARW